MCTVHWDTTAPTGIWATCLAPRNTFINPRIAYNKAAFTIGLYRDVWIAAIARPRTSLETQTAVMCVCFQRRRIGPYVTMQITLFTCKCPPIRFDLYVQRVASLTLDCNGIFAIKAYCSACTSTGITVTFIMPKPNTDR